MSMNLLRCVACVAWWGMQLVLVDAAEQSGGPPMPLTPSGEMPSTNRFGVVGTDPITPVPPAAPPVYGSKILEMKSRWPVLVMHVLAPLDRPGQGALGAPLSALKNDLLDESQRQPAASAASYALAGQLCDGLLRVDAERSAIMQKFRTHAPSFAAGAPTTRKVNPNAADLERERAEAARATAANAAETPQAANDRRAWDKAVAGYKPALGALHAKFLASLATPDPALASKTPVSRSESAVSGPLKPKNKIDELKDHWKTVLDDVLAPLDKPAPASVEGLLSALGEDLLEEAKENPGASAAAYDLGCQLCRALVSTANDRARMVARYQSYAPSREAGAPGARKLRPNWVDLERERDEAARGTHNNTVETLPARNVKTEWSTAALQRGTRLRTLYENFRKAVRESSPSPAKPNAVGAAAFQPPGI